MHRMHNQNNNFILLSSIESFKTMEVVRLNVAIGGYLYSSMQFNDHNCNPKSLVAYISSFGHKPFLNQRTKSFLLPEVVALFRDSHPLFFF